MANPKPEPITTPEPEIPFPAPPPPAPSRQTTFAVVLYAAMYFLLGALPGIIEKLADRSAELDARQLWIIGLLALLGGISNLKAYVSQTFAGWTAERAFARALKEQGKIVELFKRPAEPEK